VYMYTLEYIKRTAGFRDDDVHLSKDPEICDSLSHELQDNKDMVASEQNMWKNKLTFEICFV